MIPVLSITRQSLYRLFTACPLASRLLPAVQAHPRAERGRPDWPPQRVSAPTALGFGCRLCLPTTDNSNLLLLRHFYLLLPRN